MEAAMDFKSGEESIITLEYENLGNHCSLCYRLTHLQSQCPEKVTETHQQTPTTSPPRQNRNVSSQRQPTDTRGTIAQLPSSHMPFQQRVDRYGRPFGDRISTTSHHPQAPRNKIAPVSSIQNDHYDNRINEEQQPFEYSSPPYTRCRCNDIMGRADTDVNRNHPRNSPILEWRAKSPILAQEVTPPSAPFQVTRQSVGRNLEVSDFPPPREPPTSEVPSREEVMEEIRVATMKYINCPDPVESEARKRRVLQSEINGDVEEAANRIIQASLSAAQNQNESHLLQATAPPPPLAPVAQEEVSPATSVIPSKKRGRPPKARGQKPMIRASPKAYSGMGSKKRNIARVQSSPGASSRTNARRTVRQATAPSSSVGVSGHGSSLPGGARETEQWRSCTLLET
ncbi:Uncharacterized protein Rs2_44290 [Raphanus sativus]|nr:Uncharacterized protein Rs2_44290 [Raphanus sativus]